MPRRSPVIPVAYESDDGIEYLIRGAERLVKATSKDLPTNPFCLNLAPSNPFATPPMRLPSNIKPRYVTAKWYYDGDMRIFPDKFIVGNLAAWNEMLALASPGGSIYGAWARWAPNPDQPTNRIYISILSFVAEGRDLDIIL